MKSTSLRFVAVLITLLLSGYAYASPTTIQISVSPNDTICQGVSTTFTATVSAAGSYTYKWTINSSIVGSTAATYTSAALVNNDTVVCQLLDVTGTTVLGTSNTIIMTVDSLAVIAAITGLDSVCVNGSVHLSDATPGGVWSVSVPTAATITTAGVLTGLAPSNNNRAVYKVTNLCGTDSVRFRVRVHLAPGPITGPSSICMDSTTIFRDTTRGVWSTSDATIATFTSQFGLLQGLAAGMVTIYDSVANACGINVVSTTLQVINCDTVSAVPVVTTLNRSVSIFPNPNTGTFTLSLGGNYKGANCVISNMVGEKVKELTISSGKQTELTLNGRSGIYFITVSAGNEKYTSKIVVVQ